MRLPVKKGERKRESSRNKESLTISIRKLADVSTNSEIFVIFIS